MSLTAKDLDQIRGVMREEFGGESFRESVRDVIREEVPPIVRLEVNKQISPLKKDVAELKLDMQWVKEKITELKSEEVA